MVLQLLGERSNSPCSIAAGSGSWRVGSGAVVMHSDGTQGETAASQRAPGGPISDRSRISRRQALGRISAVVGAGTAAWVVPEILTAKPAAGAVLSGPVTSPGGSGGGGGTGGGGTGGGGTGGGGGGTG